MNTARTIATPTTPAAAPDIKIPDVTGLNALGAAFAYGAAGLYVVPVRPRKKAPGGYLGKGWPSQSVKTGPEIHAYWAEQWPLAGVGIHTGRSGLVVIDVDKPDRLDPLVRAAIVDLAPPFQVTRRLRLHDDATLNEAEVMARLRAGVLRGHAVFALPPGRMLGNGLGRLQRGWGDIRGRNGFIVTAPSWHEEDDGEYRWLRIGPVPTLPSTVADQLADADGVGAEDTATDEQVKAFKEACRDASAYNWANLVNAVLEKFRTKVQAGEGRHTAALWAAAWLCREAAAGLYSAGTALADLRREFHLAVGADAAPRASRRTRAGVDAEFNGIEAWAVGQVLGASPERLMEVRARIEAHRPQRPADGPAGTGGDQGVPGGPDGPLWPDEADGGPGGGGPMLPNLPETFWEERPYLTQIRDVARGRCASADVAFHATLARLSGMVPHWAAVDTGSGGLAPLNYFAAIVADSGVGKSSDFSVARRLLQKPWGVDFIDEAPLGSGEGIAELFMGEVDLEEARARGLEGLPGGGGEAWALDGVGDADDRYTGGAADRGDPRAPAKRRGKTEKVRTQVRHNVFITADEGTAMTELMHGRKGSTLGSTLRTAWSGGTLGNANATKDRHRIIPEGSYAIGMCVGFQRVTAAPLLEDHVAGTPQRFAWASATDPHIPEDRPAESPAYTLAWDPSVFGPPGRPGSGLTLADTIKDRLWADRRSRKAGEVQVESLDSHRPLFLVKVAGLLAVLDKRADITEDDWRLAEVVWATSCAVRDRLGEHILRVGADAARAADEAFARRQVRAAEALEQAADKSLMRIARHVGRIVHGEPGLTRGYARRKLAARDKPRFEEALRLAVDMMWVAEGPDGEPLQPGESKPADG